MMKVLMLLVFCLLVEIEVVASACPHDDKTLARWSKLHQNLPKNSTVSITSPVLLDTDVAVFGINIKQGGKLVVGPNVAKIAAYYILVAGEFHIGSEDCQFPGKLTITMFGTVNDQYSVEGLTCQKCINVIANGVIEMHGKFKRPWTKLAVSIDKVLKEDFIYNEIASKAQDKLNPEDKSGTGLLIRTFDSMTGKLKEKYSFNFRRRRFIPQNMAIIKNITKEQNDDCVLIAVRKAIIGKGQTGGGSLDELYDELEKLGHGKVTNDICLREHNFYDAFAMVACKGDKSLTRSSCGKYRLGNRFQKVEQCLLINELKLCSTSYSNSRNHGKSFAVFQLTERETTTPKLTLAQVPTNWSIGDEVCVTSTDYDWKQVECGEIVKCSDCNDKQIRLSLTTLYDHYGNVTNNVDMRAEVFVNSRNILLTSDMENFTAVDGGMVKFSEGFKTAKIENVEIENFGDSSQLGVYPVHYHLCKDVQGKTYIKNNAIHDSWSRCVVLHGTMGTVVDWNTCYICKGHAFFTEDGAEKHTTLTNNLGLGTMRTSPKIFTFFDRHPATFFLSNPYVTFTGNIAAGGESRGIKVIFPVQPTGPSASFGVMKKYEAMKTPMSMDNNVAHSYRVGFEFRDKINEHNRRSSKSLYQPQDSEGNPKETKISRLTVYKNTVTNAVVEGGLIKVIQSSFADSPVGLELLRGFFEGHGNLVLSKSTNKSIREEPGQKPCLLNSVIVGDSDNIGNPKEGEWRSLPNVKNNATRRCGMMATSGVWSVDNTWFGGFNHEFYETGAICLKQKDRFVVSPRNTFNNVAFGFEDPTDGNRVLNAVDPDDLASATIGNKVAIFYDKEGKVTSKPDSYVLQPTDCQLSDKSEVNENWYMEVSQENFAQTLPEASSIHQNSYLNHRDTQPGHHVKVSAKVGLYKIRVGTRPKPNNATMMRNDLAYQTSPANPIAAFNVITGGKYHYVMKFSEYIKQFAIGGIGITRSNAVVIGVCVPRNSSLRIHIRLPKRTRKAAPSAKDLFTSDNYQYYFDSEVGVVLFKVTNSNNFEEGDIDECPKGLCTIIRVALNSSDQTDIDCFDRYEDKYLNKNSSRRRRDDGEKKSSKPLPSTDLNKDWGAKEYELRT